MGFPSTEVTKSQPGKASWWVFITVPFYAWGWARSLQGSLPTNLFCLQEHAEISQQMELMKTLYNIGAGIQKQAEIKQVSGFFDFQLFFYFF